MMSSREKAKMVAIIEFIVLALGTIFFFFILAYSKSKRGDEELVLLLNKMEWKLSDSFKKDYRKHWAKTNRHEFLADLNDIYNRRGLPIHDSEEHITNILHGISDPSHYMGDIILDIFKILLPKYKELNYYWGYIQNSDKNRGRDDLLRELSKEFKNRLKNKLGIMDVINALEWKGHDYDTFDDDYKIYWSNDERELFRRDLISIFYQRNISIPSDDPKLIEFESKLNENTLSESKLNTLSESEIVILYINLLIEEGLSRNPIYSNQLNKANNQIAIKNIHRELDNELKNRLRNISGQIIDVINKLGWKEYDYEPFNNDYKIHWSHEERELFRSDLLDIFNKRNMYIPSDDKKLIEFESKLKENTLSESQIAMLYINLLIGESLSRDPIYFGHLDITDNEIAIKNILKELENELKKRKIPEPPSDTELESILIKLKWTLSDSFKQDFKNNWPKEQRQEFLEDLKDIYNRRKLLFDESEYSLDRILRGIDDPTQFIGIIILEILLALISKDEVPNYYWQYIHDSDDVSAKDDLFRELGKEFKDRLKYTYEQILDVIKKLGWKEYDYDSFNNDYKIHWSDDERKVFRKDLLSIFNQRHIRIPSDDPKFIEFKSKLIDNTLSESEIVILYINLLVKEEELSRHPIYSNQLNKENNQIAIKNIRRDLDNEFKNRIKYPFEQILPVIKKLGWKGYDYEPFNADYNMYWSNEEREDFRRDLLSIFDQRKIHITSHNRKLIEFESKLKENTLSESEIVILYINLLIEQEELSRNPIYSNQLNKVNNQITIKNIHRELSNELKNRQIPPPPTYTDLYVMLRKLNWKLSDLFKEDFKNNWSKEQRHEFLLDLIDIFDGQNLYIPSDDPNLIEFKSKLNGNKLPESEIVILYISLLTGKSLSRKPSYGVQLEKINNKNEIVDIIKELKNELKNKQETVIPTYPELESLLIQLNWIVSDSFRRDYHLSWTENGRKRLQKFLNVIYNARNIPFEISDDSKKLYDSAIINIEDKLYARQRVSVSFIFELLVSTGKISWDDFIVKNNKETLQDLVREIKKEYQSRRDISKHGTKLKTFKSIFYKNKNTKAHERRNEYLNRNHYEQPFEDVVHFWAITILGYNSYENHESTQGTQVFVFLSTMILLMALNLLLYDGILRNVYENCLIWIFAHTTIIVIIIKYDISLFWFGAPVILILCPILCYALYRILILYYVLEFLFDTNSNSSTVDIGVPVNEAEDSDISNIPSMANSDN